MLEVKYTEDLFISLTDHVQLNAISYQPQDYKPMMSFKTLIKNGDPLTEKQGKFVLILLGKYKKQLEAYIGQTIDIEVLQWRYPFRVIDYSKSLVLKNNDNGYPCAYLKFPYTLKDSFDKTFKGAYPYNGDSGTREVPLLSVNPIQLLEFCVFNNFDIENEFIDYVDQVEEIWEKERTIVPYCMIENDTVVLVNAFSETQDYFEKNKFNDVYKDSYLARSLGFPLATTKQDPLSKICANIDDTHFWSNNLDNVADILVKLDLDRVVVVLDRQADSKRFIVDLLDKLNERCYNSNTIRVCFRGPNNNEQGKEFNKWIKMNNLGGKVDSGKIFIFKHSIAKWVKNFDFKPQLAISNFIYESTNVSTRNFLKACRTTITVSDMSPTTRKENKIVQL